MKLSTKVRYGIEALSELAYNEGRPILLKDISKNYRISLKYLDHIFSELKTKGLIKKIKAKKGGYLLAKKPSEITVYEIINSLEGIEIVDCIEKNISCSIIKICGARVVWEKIKNNIRKMTNGITLKDIVDEKRKLEKQYDSSYTFYI